MFEVTYNAFGNIRVDNTKSTNGLMATLFDNTTGAADIINACVANWSLDSEQKQELIGAMLGFFRANMSFGDVARSMGYDALVD